MCYHGLRVVFYDGLQPVCCDGLQPQQLRLCNSMRRKRPDGWAWAAGGLDLNARSLGELRPTEVPPADPPKALRVFFEGRGYKVRCKGRARRPYRGKGAAKESACSQSPGPRRVRKSVMKKAVWFCLSPRENKVLYGRHRMAITDANERLQFEIGAESEGPLQQDAEEIGIYWWDDPTGCGRLSDNNRKGLLTAVVLGGIAAKLYSYTAPTNLPHGVEWRSAEDVLPSHERDVYRSQKVSPAVIADLGRLRAMKKELEGGATFVWFIDLDVQWAKGAKTACSQLPAAAFQHLIATMEGVEHSRAGYKATWRKGMLEFLRWPFDYQYAATPFRVTSRTTLVDALLQDLERNLAQGATHYLVFMDSLQHHVAKCGLLGAYCDPSVFSGAAFTRGARWITERAPDGLTVDIALHDAVGFSSFWQSGKTGHGDLCSRGSHARVCAGSWWAQLLRHLDKRMEHQLRPGNDRAIGLQPVSRRRHSKKKRDPTGDVTDPLPWSSVEPHPDSRAAAFCQRPERVPLLAEWQSTQIRQRCQLSHKLGRGTYGDVYAGKYIGEALQVAVKVSRADRLHMAVGATEIAVLLKLQGHPNVIALRDYFYSPYFAVLVMAKMEESVHSALKTRSLTGGLQPDIARYISKMLARGVAHMHGLQFLHRDLHAGNVLLSLARGHLTACSQVRHVCVADFGQACDAQGDRTNARRSARRGAQQIVPPECALAHASGATYDKPADVWAVGVNLLLMVGGVSAMPCGSDVKTWSKTCTKLLGCVDRELCVRRGWTFVEPPRPATRRSPVRALEGGAGFVDHFGILLYDPQLRPTAAQLETFW